MMGANKVNHPILRLFEAGRQLVYQKGETILRAGDAPSGVYAITEGWVKVYTLCDDGEPNIIMSMGQGDVFPLEWALTGMLRDNNFAALRSTTIRRISREEFLDSMQQDPDFSKAVSIKLADYFFRLSEELENIPYRNARERVAFRLLALTEDFGEIQNNLAQIKIKVPNEFIARSSNMTRETASREIACLTRKGLVSQTNGYIIIKDLMGLKREVSSSFELSRQHLQQI